MWLVSNHGVVYNITFIVIKEEIMTVKHAGYISSGFGDLYIYIGVRPCKASMHFSLSMMEFALSEGMSSHYTEGKILNWYDVVMISCCWILFDCQGFI